MKKRENKLLILRQMDKKLQNLSTYLAAMPSSGWIKMLRTMLGMSLKQLGSRMSITPQSLREIEMREAEGTITLRTLKEAADALNMVLVYGFVSKDGSIEKMVERRAQELATQIVTRTSTTMKLEDQENSKERINQAIQELTEELKREMPKSLWD
ncbi:mobile mystery protein A [Pseudoflavitalea rhizosphaerae]|uniref:mobile mystery protein A n=1 Tax=Pseudoflavitalea rhizosphaerae TaxID=1884793 RepID=UPI000F8C9375|nr:mobile mystery protein A [Pseudoflavitalea rhizosphaerae]